MSDHKSAQSTIDSEVDQILGMLGVGVGADWIAADELMGDDAEHDVLLAAMRAAGIEE